MLVERPRRGISTRPGGRDEKLLLPAAPVNCVKFFLGELEGGTERVLFKVFYGGGAGDGEHGG